VRSIGCRFLQAGDQQDVMVGHTIRGFALLGEKVLEFVLARAGQPVPVQDDENVDRKVDLQMACIAAQEPGIDEATATGYLHTGFLAEHQNCYDNLIVPPHMLQEVVSATEAKAVADYDAALSQVKLMKKHHQATRNARSKKYFKKTVAPKFKAALSHYPKWVAAKNPKLTEVADWIHNHVPPVIKVYTDEIAGRFRVVGPDLNIKSVAWTKRGFKAAAMETIHSAWEFYTDHTSHECPFSVDALRKEFEEGAVAAA